jgi:hypothetical protein
MVVGMSSAVWVRIDGAGGSRLYDAENRGEIITRIRIEKINDSQIFPSVSSLPALCDGSHLT